ncbi:hypothetical protein FM21_02395 [Streptomyces mutabilis]|uniref:Uncharacterized protein n=1 Tax=Streptomyces mutabilis TaxID=67332 RepID=A0A086N1K4_9ACTN|nr:hypothetical protein FM21_02395 [Streptomyces mutabilis]
MTSENVSEPAAASVLGGFVQQGVNASTRSAPTAVIRWMRFVRHSVPDADHGQRPASSRYLQVHIRTG